MIYKEGSQVQNVSALRESKSERCRHRDCNTDLSPFAKRCRRLMLCQSSVMRQAHQHMHKLIVESNVLRDGVISPPASMLNEGA